MKYIVQDAEGKKMFMEVVSTIPLLPDGFQVLGKAEELPEVVAEMEAAASKEAQVKAAYDSMNADIYAEMATVFGTTNPESATAYNETYKLMKESPADFIGADFADEAAVIAFADAKLATIKAYAIYRLNRIKQFQTERDAILNG